MARRRLSPYLVILLGFLFMIVIGSILLVLPVSTYDGIEYEDAFFLSASSVCITGLATVNLVETFTGFGQAVIALLIQVGGLGFVTIGMTVVATLRMRLGATGRRLVDETLGGSGKLAYRKFLMRAILITAISEVIGFAINLIALKENYSGGELVWISLFHSVSAFNNAGLDLFGEGMLAYSDNVLLLLNTCFLTIVGGLGFIVINDVVCTHNWRKFGVHTKIVLVMTPILLMVGTLLIFFSEWGNIDFLNAFFMSTMSRTCGFATQDIGTWSPASRCIIDMLMLIGAAPVSTGGGIKCTTAFVLLAVLMALIRAKPTTAFHRRISTDTIIHSMMITLVAIVYTFVIGTIVCALEPAVPLEFVFTETISALANVGFSAGITPLLCTASKYVLAFAMFLGRIGFMTVILVFRKRWTGGGGSIDYVQADIIVG